MPNSPNLSINSGINTPSSIPHIFSFVDMQSPSKKILVIDDEESIHDIISLIFEEFNYQVKGIFNSTNIEEKVLTYGPDLILLDIYFGNTDGRLVCNALKESPLTAHIPIILLSAANLQKDTLNCYPDDFIEKPFEINDLINKVKSLI